MGVQPGSPPPNGIWDYLNEERSEGREEGGKPARGGEEARAVEPREGRWSKGRPEPRPGGGQRPVQFSWSVPRHLLTPPCVSSRASPRRPDSGGCAHAYTLKVVGCPVAWASFTLRKERESRDDVPVGGAPPRQSWLFCVKGDRDGVT